MIPIAAINRILKRVSTEALIGSYLLRADGASISVSAIEIDEQNGETYLIADHDGKSVLLGMSVFSSANFVGMEVNSPELKEALILDLEEQGRSFVALRQRWEKASEPGRLVDKWSAALDISKNKLDDLKGSDFLFKALKSSKDQLSNLEKRFNKFSEIAKLTEKVSESFSQGSLYSERSYFVKSEVIKSGLDFILHATPIGNLENILKFGLVTREDSRSEKLDEDRWDGRLDHISFSINNLSPYLYAKFGNAQLKESICILRINRKILWQREAKFLFSNAAMRAYNYSGAADHKFHSALAYREMWFGGNRDAQSSDGYPESPFDRQAEVQIPGNIGLEYFTAVCLHETASKKTKEDVKSLAMKYAPHIDTLINNPCFDTRN
jgi:hypothetical protein